MEADGGGEGTADGDVRMGDRAEEEDRAGQASDESGGNAEGDVEAGDVDRRGKIRERQEDDEDGEEGETGRWLARMGRRRKKAAPVQDKRGERKTAAHQRRLAERIAGHDEAKGANRRAGGTE